MTKYRALVDLRYPTDPAIIERLLKGETIPDAQLGHVRDVKAGHTVDDIPATSVAGLLAKGRIEVVPDAPHVRSTRAERREEED